MSKHSKSPNRLGACVLVVAITALVGGLTACGGVSDNATVIRVGGQGISKAVVDRWTDVVAHGGAFSGMRGRPGGAAKRRALVLLISSSWLIGEAARERTPVTDGAVEAALARRRSENAELQEQLKTTGQTVAGLELEIRSELAAQALRKKLAERAADISQREVLDYYERNIASFSKPEVRITDLVEGIPSFDAAAALAKRIGTVSRFPRNSYREYVTQTPGFTGRQDKAELVRAIFAARPGAISHPFALDSEWTIFVVRRIVPPVPQPLAKVRAEVSRRLIAARQGELDARFDREYTSLWRSRTICQSGYVAPGCAQSGRSLGSYEDPFSRRG